MFARNSQGERRVSPSQYKFLLAMHIIVSGTWLGTVFAKLALGLVAITTSAPGLPSALYLATNVLNAAFPPVAIGTIVTGVFLSLGTKWGLLKHYWVATKLVLSVGVIMTAVQLADRFVRQSISALSGQAVDNGTILGIALAPTTFLIALSVAHLLMLGAATVLSVYKPWGKTWFGRRRAARLRMDHTR